MRKLLTILLALIFVLLAGCQPTPEEPVVIQKDLEQMIGKAQQTLAPEAEKLPLTERYAVKEHLEKTITVLDGKLVVNVDADVGVPATDAISIVRVVPANHDQETVTALFNALCGDTAMYQSRQDELTYTRAEIDDILVMLRQKISELEAPGGDEDELMYLRDEVQYFENAYADAPETIADVPADGTLAERDVYYGDTFAGTNTVTFAVEYPGRYYDGCRGKVFHVYNNSDQTQAVEYEGPSGKQKKIYPLYQASLEYRDERYYSDDLWERSAWKRVFTQDDLTQTELESAGITPEEAAEAARRLFAEAQIPFSATGIFYVEAPGPCYMLDCSRQVNGANLTTAGEGVGGDGLSPFWGYERMSLFVSKEGVVYLYWYSPYEVMETTVENATLKPFEDIEDIFYTMMKTIYGPAAKEENSTTIKVSYVSLQLQRIKTAEDNSEGLLTPVWCFYGIRYVDERIPNYGMVSDWAAMGYSPLLIVNAVDGTIIDLEKGY
jgi:hypothetical protein